LPTRVSALVLRTSFMTFLTGVSNMESLPQPQALRRRYPSPEGKN
jgi:hypothetical protein